MFRDHWIPSSPILNKGLGMRTDSSRLKRIQHWLSMRGQSMGIRYKTASLRIRVQDSPSRVIIFILTKEVAFEIQKMFE
jgi:hypothetical protein